MESYKHTEVNEMVMYYLSSCSLWYEYACSKNLPIVPEKWVVVERTIDPTSKGNYIMLKAQLEAIRPFLEEGFHYGLFKEKPYTPDCKNYIKVMGLV